MTDRYIGLMSGTALDGADGVLVEWTSGVPRVIAAASLDYPETLRAECLALNSSGPDELHRAAEVAHQLAVLYSRVVHALTQQAHLSHTDIRGIGVHGQTVRHQPPGVASGAPYTWQINQPALLAEWTGIDVVADFRSRDVAAGGQGVPLVPGFHREIFGQSDATVAVVNVGGMANVTLLPAQEGPVTGFDTGPGNVLLDLWCQRHTGAWFDRDGAWGATGTVHHGLLQHLLQEPYFQRRGRKSTGRDLFHAEWLDNHVSVFDRLPPQDVQATLAALTAITIAQCILESTDGAVGKVVVCGGGSRNHTLLQALQAAMADVPVEVSDTLGWPAHWVEAAAFAWLARRFVHREAGNLPSVTGAQGPRVLGALYPA